MFIQNFIKLSAAVHELPCPQTFLHYLRMAKNLKSGSVTLTLDYDLEILWVLSRNMFMQNFIELSATVNELSCLQ